MIESAALSRLKEIVGSANCHTNKEMLLVHGFDATLPQFQPEVVVFAVTTQQVSDIMKVAQEYGILSLPGSRHQSQRGQPAGQRGIALVLTKMNKILEIDTKNLVVCVEPGVINQDLQDALPEQVTIIPRTRPA